MMKVQAWLMAGAVCGLTSLAQADSAAEAELRTTVDRLERRLAEVENKNASGQLDQRRAEEVRALIQEVLADADTRASMMQDGLAAGHDGKAFFLASPDGKFRMNVGGQLQFRYLFNFENHIDDEEENDDNEDEGFQFRRMKVSFGGHVSAGVKWDYELVLAGERDSGTVLVEDAIIGTKITDNLGVKFGKFKLPFLREELNSSKRLLTVERASVTEYFTLDRAEQVQLTFSSDMVKAIVSINDGADSEFTDIGSDQVELSVTGRVDIKLAGDWKQMDDVSAWSGEPLGLFVGGAVHYQLGDSNNPGGTQGAAYATADYLAWTVDASLETGGFGIMAAIMGGHIEPDADGATDRDMLGFLVQAGFMLIPDKLEPFVRFEWIDDDDAADVTDEAMLVTVGFNYYFQKHNAKFTLDVVWWLDGNDPSGNTFGNSEAGTGLGFSSGDAHEEDSVLLRLQFQLLF